MRRGYLSTFFRTKKHDPVPFAVTTFITPNKVKEEGEQANVKKNCPTVFDTRKKGMKDGGRDKRKRERNQTSNTMQNLR